MFPELKNLIEILADGCVEYPTEAVALAKEELDDLERKLAELEAKKKK